MGPVVPECSLSYLDFVVPDCALPCLYCDSPGYFCFPLLGQVYVWQLFCFGVVTPRWMFHQCYVATNVMLQHLSLASCCRVLGVGSVFFHIVNYSHCPWGAQFLWWPPPGLLDGSADPIKTMGCCLWCCPESTSLSLPSVWLLPKGAQTDCLTQLPPSLLCMGRRIVSPSCIHNTQISSGVFFTGPPSGGLSSLSCAWDQSYLWGAKLAGWRAVVSSTSSSLG